MNAKLLSIALLVIAAFDLRAQNPAPATNTLSHDELLRRTAANRPEKKLASTDAATADWSTINSPKSAGVSAEKLTAALAATQATAPAVPAATSSPALRPTRRPVALPGAPGAAPAAAIPAIPARINPTLAAVAQSVIAPGLSAESISIRPPSTASTITNPDEIVPALSINFPNADLDQFLTVYTEFVGRNLLRPATLPAAKIVLKQTTPLTKLEVVRMMEAALSLNMVAVINVGEKFVTVMPSAEAYKIPGIINTNVAGDLPVLGSMVTHVVQLKNSKPSEMVPILTPFASGTAANPVMPVDSSGILVLRDNVANVKRMLEMIEKVDIVGSSEIESKVIPIKYAKAEEIASALSSVGGGGGGTIGSRPAASTSVGSGASRLGSQGQPGYNQPGAVPGATPTPSGGGTFGDRLNSIIRKASASGELTILGTTKIIADIRSNSLLVFAGKQDMEMIEKIISQLDVVLAQVLIETVIMDVSLSDSKSLGVSYFQKPVTIGQNSSGVGAINNVGFLSSSSFDTATNGVAAIGKGLSYFGKFGQDLDVTLTAVATDSSVKVIQKPRIMTSHATPGKIFIGSTVPYVSSTYYGGGFGGGPSSSYQQLRVGIDLSVTPFINQDGLVVMKIEEAIDELGKSVPITGVGDVPSTVSRTLSGEIAVRDRETIVLGGFIRTGGSDGKSGVPILKDIPLIGMLFNNTSKSKDRSELVVLMRPTVLQTPELAAAYTAEEKSRLPGVRRAEAESLAEEKRQIKAADRALGVKHKPDSIQIEVTQPAPVNASPNRDAQGYLIVPE
jgi:type II secretory pathway component GspD/PulD (secretin)